MALSFAVGMMMGNGGGTINLGSVVSIMKEHPVPEYSDMNNISATGGDISDLKLSKSGFSYSGVDSLKGDKLGRGQCCVYYQYKTKDGSWKWGGGFLDWMRPSTSDSFRPTRDWHNWPGLGQKIVSEFNKSNGNVNEVKMCVYAEDGSCRSSWATA